MPAPAAQTGVLQDAGTWKFAAGLVIGYCVRAITSKLNLKVGRRERRAATGPSTGLPGEAGHLG